MKSLLVVLSTVPLVLVQAGTLKLIRQAMKLSWCPNPFFTNRPGHNDNPSAGIQQWAREDQAHASPTNHNFPTHFKVEDIYDKAKLPEWCGNLLKSLSAEQRELKMDFYVVAVCVDPSPEFDPQDWLARILQTLPYTQLLAYYPNILRQWLYLVHKDYHALPTRKEEMNEYHRFLEEWSETEKSNKFNDQNSGFQVEEKQKNAIIPLPRGQYDMVHQSLNDKDFNLMWIDPDYTSDEYLLSRAPILLAVKYNKSSVVSLLHLILSCLYVTLPNQEALVSHPDVQKFAQAYPLYFKTNRDLFGGPADHSTSVFTQVFQTGYHLLAFPLSVVPALKTGDYQELDRLLHPPDPNDPVIHKETFLTLAIYTLTLAHKMSPDIQSQVLDKIQQLAEQSQVELPAEAIEKVKRGYVCPPMKLLENVMDYQSGRFQVALVKQR